MSDDLKTTPLDSLHVESGGRMVPFAGWSMPVQYPSGILKEHRQCREGAALFDVSHMCQLVVRGGDAVQRMERIVPGDIAALEPGGARYTMLTNAAGGILDDLIVTRTADGLFIVVNAARRDHDVPYICEALAGCEVTELTDHALLALQGPKAVGVLSGLAREITGLAFMQSAEIELSGLHCRVSRLGYTGEDGCEISVPAGSAVKLARTLLASEHVELAGLGARDSLRLEAGLCLYGQDIDETTSPIEAGLAWTISKRRRATADFPGATRILSEIANKPARRLVGIRPQGRSPAREGCDIETTEGAAIGKVTSGGFGPTVEAPVAMGYVDRASSVAGTQVHLMVRGKPVAAEIVSLPFVPHRYHR